MLLSCCRESSKDSLNFQYPAILHLESNATRVQAILWSEWTTELPEPEWLTFYPDYCLTPKYLSIFTSPRGDPSGIYDDNKLADQINKTFQSPTTFQADEKRDSLLMLTTRINFNDPRKEPIFTAILAMINRTSVATGIRSTFASRIRLIIKESIQHSE